MSLIAFGGMPLVPVGVPIREGVPYLSSLSADAVAAANAAVIMYGLVFTEDGGSHTIDTTGSSSIGWRSGSVTFANAGTTVAVGLAAMDLANGPPGRAANVAGVITLSVSRSMTGGGGGVTANAWQEHVPTAGTKTIANGELVAFAVQMTTRGGADTVAISGEATVSSTPVLPGYTKFDGTSTYTAITKLPNMVITFSDGVRGYFYGGYVASTGSTTQTWNNTSGTKEYGNFFQMPVPGNVYGLITNCSVGGDTDFILYSSPLGTPSAERTISVDANAIGVSAINSWMTLLFSSPYSAAANQPLAAIMKPTSATNVSSPYKTFNSSAHQTSEMLGANGYAVNRNTGAFAAQNSNKDRFAIGLLVGAFDDGAGSTITGISRARAAAGA